MSQVAVQFPFYVSFLCPIPSCGPHLVPSLLVLPFLVSLPSDLPLLTRTLTVYGE